VDDDPDDDVENHRAENKQPLRENIHLFHRFYAYLRNTLLR
jgi:hypothetical protein